MEKIVDAIQFQSIFGSGQTLKQLSIILTRNDLLKKISAQDKYDYYKKQQISPGAMSIDDE